METEHLNKVKSYLEQLDIYITREDSAEHLVVINDESRGLHEMILDVEEDLLIIEQFIMPMTDSADFHKRLLQMNRQLIHGAFALDESGDRLIFRDTLQLANLDLNELESSINALGLALVEFGNEFISAAKGGQ